MPNVDCAGRGVLLGLGTKGFRFWRDGWVMIDRVGFGLWLLGQGQSPCGRRDGELSFGVLEETII